MTNIIDNPLALSDTTAPPHIRIQPMRGWVSLQLHELWSYRELLYFLAWRDVKVRYKQTALGALWAILVPVLNMVVFTVIFGNFAKMPSDGIPYPIFSYTALLPWTYFATSLSGASNSLLGSASMITKVYFPRLIVPISSVFSGLIDFSFAFLVMIGMMFFYHTQPTIYVLLLPLFLILAMVTALGFGLWLSAFNVKYRDVRYIVPFLIQFWNFATPVIYPSSLLSEPWRTLSGLNPMVGVIEGFRWALLGSKPPELMIIVSTVMAVIVLVTGAFYFRRMEKNFADLV